MSAHSRALRLPDGDIRPGDQVVDGDATADTPWLTVLAVTDHRAEGDEDSTCRGCRIVLVLAGGPSWHVRPGQNLLVRVPVDLDAAMSAFLVDDRFRAYQQARKPLAEHRLRYGPDDDSLERAQLEAAAMQAALNLAEEMLDAGREGAL